MSATAEQIEQALRFRDEALRLRIPMCGPSNRATGYGVYFVQLLLDMQKLGADISLWPTNLQPPLPPEFLATLLEPFPIKPVAGIVMENPPGLFKIAKNTIGISMWETTRLAPSVMKNPGEIDIIVVPCRDNIDTFREHWPNAEYHYQYIGIDTSFWEPVERDWNPDVLKIGMFGHLTYRKGIDIALEAFLDCYENDPSVELHIATTHYENPVFFHPIAKNVHVHMFGNKTREEVREFYSTLHGLFAPSRGEGFFMPGAEFMATGGCFIAPCALGPAAYHKSDTGWVIPSHFEPVLHWGDLHGPEAREYGEWIGYEPSDVRDTLQAFVQSSPAEKRIKGQRAADQIPFLLDPVRAAQSMLDLYVEAFNRG